jgi:hypothetical protein
MVERHLVSLSSAPSLSIGMLVAAIALLQPPLARAEQELDTLADRQVAIFHGNTTIIHGNFYQFCLLLLITGAVIGWKLKSKYDKTINNFMAPPKRYREVNTQSQATYSRHLATPQFKVCNERETNATWSAVFTKDKGV